MIKIDNVEVMGWEHAIRGMRNPMNSWDKSDSDYGCSDRKPCLRGCEDWYDCHGEFAKYILGKNDLTLAKKLADAGPVHGKFLRMIAVYMDITAPLYWWKEFDTYKVGTVANSCSTMHKIHAKEFTLDDFSHEHMMQLSYDSLLQTIRTMDIYRKKYVETKDKRYWDQIIQLLPTSYNQKRTVMLNYEVLRNMYNSRKNHKLDEWRTFCHKIEELPYAELIIGKEE